MINFALISGWHVHVKTFGPAINASGKARITTVWDDDAERGKLWAQRLGAEYNGDLDAVLADEDITAVLVQCPTTRHKEILTKCAAAKKDIFTDKALEVKVEDCLEIQKAVEQSGIRFGVAHEYMCASAYRYAKKLMDAGKLGEVCSVYFRRAHDGGLPRATWLADYWFDPAQTGGGATFDLGCHGFYLLNYFAGTPKRVTALMNQPQSAPYDENSTTVIEFENGIIGTAHTSFLASYMDNTLEIIGSEGTLLVTGLDEGQYVMRLQSSRMPGYENGLATVPESEFAPCALPFAPAAFVDFLAANTGEKSMDEFSIERAITTVKMINCAYRSQREGATVEY